MLAEAYIEQWRDVEIDPFYRELVMAVLNRVSQGMDDAGIIAYLDYRKRGTKPGSEERAIIDDVATAFKTAGTRIRDDVEAIRQAEARAQTERLKKAREEAKDMELMPGVSDEIYRLWRAEQRYKLSLVPPGARGGVKNRRKRKKERPKRRVATRSLQWILRHEEYLASRVRANRGNAKGGA